ncbi:MAG: hypothetical protein VCA17_07590 [Dehalococcoidia bacterium]
MANGADKLAVDVETKLGSDGEKHARFREELAAAKRWVTSGKIGHAGNYCLMAACVWRFCAGARGWWTRML